MSARLAIVIVNWNSGSLLRECLDSIAANQADSVTIDLVTVVDNASKDASLSGVSGTRALPLRIIANDTNLGFAAACNQGATGGEGDYILFLNPDMRLDESSLSVPLDFMDDPANRDVAITGIQLVDADGAVTRSCSRFPTPFRLLLSSAGQGAAGIMMSDWDHAADREVDQVMGAFFLVRRSVFEQLGGFDERFFVYFEDVDFSLRARQAGWRSVYLTGAKASHHGAGTTAQVRPERLSYSLASRILFSRKHFSRAGVWLVYVATLVVEPVARLCLSLVHRSAREAADTLKGYLALCRRLPDLLDDRASDRS